MKINPSPKFDGPINGENLTSDARNYPWHRPPEITGFNAGVTRLIENMDEEREMQLIYSLLELEIPVAIITSNMLMRNIAKGVLPIDLAVLMAGPVARYIEILAKDNNVKADMDTSIPGQEPITPTMLKLQMGSVEDLQDVLEEQGDDLGEVIAEEESTGGLMGSAPDEISEAASQEEQAAMLGMTDEEEELV